MEKKTKYLIIGLCCIFGIILGTTTAWYTWTSSESTDVTFTIGGITITYEAGPNIDKNLRPTSSKETGVANNYAIKKDITVSATKTAYLNLYLTAETLPEILSHKSLKWEVYEGSTLLNDGNFDDVSEGDKITISPDIVINSTTRNLSLYIWIDGNIENPSDMSNQDYKFVLSADASDKTPDSLQTLTNLGLTQYLNEGTPNFANVATTDEGIYAAIDDLGTSYYFRGSSEHNYVKFGRNLWRAVIFWLDGYYDTEEECQEAMINNGLEDNVTDCYYQKYSNKYVAIEVSYGDYKTEEECLTAGGHECMPLLVELYFRIIRINGDGTIRLIYDGENVHRNGENLENLIVPFNDWLFINIEETGLSDYIADAIYCSDNRVKRTYFDYVKGAEKGYYYNYFGAHERLNIEKPIPSLKCLSYEGSFSSDYSVGTITADEVAFAGGRFGLSNMQYYLYTGFDFTTASPAIWEEGVFMPGESGADNNGYYFGVGDNGNVSTSSFDYLGDIFAIGSNIYIDPWEFELNFNIRPVISLKADTEFTGTGTWEDPFVIKLSE